MVENLVVVGGMICLDLDSSCAMMEVEVTVGRMSSACGLKKGGWTMHALRCASPHVLIKSVAHVGSAYM